MTDQSSGLVKIASVQGHLTADVLKSHLEHEGIPAVLRYESAGQVFGLTVDGLGQVDILVPAELADIASQIIAPQESDETGA